jgi:hypothetical protein
VNIRYAISRLSPNTRVILLVALIASLVIGIVAAAGSLTQNITYTKPSKSISWSEPSTLDYGVGDTLSHTYTVVNDGNVAATVTPSATATGATCTWDKTSATISPGGSETFKLTLTVTASGTGTVTFTAS